MSSPFAKLSGMFPEHSKKPQKSGAPSAASRRPAQTAPPPEEDEDAALFLNAVSGANSFAAQGKGQAPQSAKDKGMIKGTPVNTAKPEDNPFAKTFKAAPPKDAPAAAPPPVPCAPPSEDEALFSKAMSGVAPVTGKGRELPKEIQAKQARRQTEDSAKALRDLLEGKVEFALSNTEEYLEGFVTGVDPLVVGRLRAGQYSPEAHIDLHGQNSRQAFDTLSIFVKHAYQKSMRTVVVVTGRGRNSPDGVGILRNLLGTWLTKEPFKRVVLAFCTARPEDGGPGAVYVLLRKYKKSRGKIVWENACFEEEFSQL